MIWTLASVYFFSKGLWPTSEKTLSLTSLCSSWTYMPLHPLCESQLEGLRGWSFSLLNLFSKSPDHVARDSSMPSSMHYSSSNHSLCVENYSVSIAYTQREYTLTHYSFRPLKLGGFSTGVEEECEHYSWWLLFVGRLLKLAVWGLSARLREEHGVIW